MTFNLAEEIVDDGDEIELPINEIEATAATQVRAKIDPEVVDEYAAAMKRGDKFPRGVVFSERGSHRYILADGFTPGHFPQTQRGGSGTSRRYPA